LLDTDHGWERRELYRTSVTVSGIPRRAARLFEYDWRHPWVFPEQIHVDTRIADSS
jgi:hypothetical protein